jgi:hypothetical protein
MAPNNVCPQHGPYDSDTCPYCSGGFKRPPAPTPLDDDDQPTDIGFRQQGRSASHDFLDEDDMPTNVDFASSRASGNTDDEAPTMIKASRGGRRFLDPDEDEETSLGRAHRDDGDATEIDIVPTGMLGILWVKEGRRRGKIYNIKNNTFIGRKEGAIQLSDPKVSTPHAKFMIEDDAFTIWDCGSTNGTFVNGEKIRAATVLAENDVIKIGDIVFVIKVMKSV